MYILTSYWVFVIRTHLITIEGPLKKHTSFWAFESNSIPKPHHSTTRHNYTIWIPDMSGIRIPTVHRLIVTHVEFLTDLFSFFNTEDSFLEAFTNSSSRILSVTFSWNLFCYDLQLLFGAEPSHNCQNSFDTKPGNKTKI